MENLNIKQTKITPQVDFNADNGKLVISGDSYPENAMQFYQPIFSWLNDFLAKPATNVIFDFKLNYFNTSSSKCLLNIMEILEKAHNNEIQIELNWYYEKDDEDMLESGQDFAEDMSLPFNFLPY